MTQISRYILRQLAGPFLFFLVILTGIVWLIEALRFLDLILNRGQDAATFFRLALYLTPSVLETVMPLALLCAIIYTLNRLRSDSEMVVMWAAGLNRWAIAKPILLLSLVVTIVLYMLALELTPLGQRAVRSMMFELREDLAGAVVQEGTFNSPAKGLTIYVKNRHDSDNLEGILVHDTRKPEAPVTYMAAQGKLVQTDGKPRLIMVGGNIQQISAKTGTPSILSFERYSFDLSQFAEQDNLFIWYKPSQRPFSELLDPDQFAQSDREKAKFRNELHTRLSGPAYAIIFAAIALAAMLSQGFSRAMQNNPVVVAIAAAVLVRIAGLAISNQIGADTAMVPVLYGFQAGVLVIALAILNGRPHFGPKRIEGPA